MEKFMRFHTKTKTDLIDSHFFTQLDNLRPYGQHKSYKKKTFELCIDHETRIPQKSSNNPQTYTFSNQHDHKSDCDKATDKRTRISLDFSPRRKSCRGQASRMSPDIPNLVLSFAKNGSYWPTDGHPRLFELHWARLHALNSPVGFKRRHCCGEICFFVRWMFCVDGGGCSCLTRIVYVSSMCIFYLFCARFVWFFILYRSDWGARE